MAVAMKNSSVIQTITLFIILSIFNSVVSQNYIISRVASNNVRARFPDIVKIPPSECVNSTGEDECLALGGNKDGNCQCTCSKQTTFKNVVDSDQLMYNSSTFGFIGNKWKCQGNEAIRKYTGCSLSVGLTSEENQPVLTIPLNQSAKYPIFDHSKQPQPGPLDRSGCTLNATNSFLIKCHGYLEPMKQIVLNNRFGLEVHKDEKIEYLVVSNETDPEYRLPSGGIIKLGITCGFDQKTHRCMVLKVEGNIECPVQKPNTSLPLPSPSSTEQTRSTAVTKVSSTTAHTHSPSPTVPSSSTPTLSSSPVMTSTTTHSLSPSPTFPPLSTSSTSSFSSITTSTSSSSHNSVPLVTKPTPSKVTSQIYSTSSIQTTPDVPTKVGGRGNRNSGRNSMLIGLILAGILLFVIAIFIIVLIIIKRQKKRRRARSQSSAFMVENDSYEQVTEVPPFELHHDNKISDPDYYNTMPGAQEKMKKKETPFKKALRTSVSNEVYQTVEHLPNNAPTSISFEGPEARIVGNEQAPENKYTPSNNGPGTSQLENIRENTPKNEPLYNEPGTIIHDNEGRLYNDNDEDFYYNPEEIISDSPKGTNFQGPRDDGHIYNTLNEPLPNKQSQQTNLQAPNVYESLSRINERKTIEEGEGLYEQIC